MTPRFVDARGLKCPWPVLRLARAMAEAEVVAILADDANAPDEIAAVAEARGWTVRRDDQSFLVSRAGTVPD